MFGQLVNQFLRESIINQNNQNIDYTFDDIDLWKPPSDVLDDENQLCIFLLIPGVDKSSLSIDILNNDITITGYRELLYVSEKYNITKNEITTGNFRRKIRMPLAIINQDSISTDLKNGILKITINKLNEQRNRLSIRIEGND